MPEQSVRGAVPDRGSEELRRGISNYMALGFALMKGSVQASQKATRAQAVGLGAHPERISSTCLVFLGGVFSAPQQKQFLFDALHWHLANPTSKLKYSRKRKGAGKTNTL